MKNYKEFNVNAEQVYENVVMNLVNTARNRRLLEQVPHKDLEDLGLSIIYRWHKNGISSIITLNVCMLLGLHEDELHEHAEKNTKTLMSPRVISLGDGMWIISNNAMCLGAICMLMGDCTKFIANKMDSNLYILPSSIHEVIAIPANKDFDRKAMRKSIREINRDIVNEVDFLSNELYYFDRASEKVLIAKD